MSSEENVVLETDEVQIDVDGFVLDDQVELAKQENEGVTFHVKGVNEKLQYHKVNGEVRPVTLTVAGAHSDYFRKAEKMIRARKLKPKDFTGQVVYDDNIEKVAACILAWDGFYSRSSPGGPLVPVKLTPHNVKETLKKCPWVLEQAQEVMTDHERFFDSPSQKPSNT